MILGQWLPTILFFSNVFNVGDILWVDGLEPNTAIETQYGNGASGNAIVKKCFIR